MRRMSALLVLAVCLVAPTAFGGPAKAGQGKALVVVDIQEDCTGRILKPPFLYQKDSDTFIRRINELTGRAVDGGVLLIYLRTNMKRQEVPGAQLDARLEQRSPHCFLKDTLDAFASSDRAFSRFLLSRKEVTDLYLVGLDATLCVRETARAAVKRGYRATVVTDLVRTISGAPRDELEKMYANDGVRVMTGAQFLATP
jgi:nicotinamidase/pyrazinamidase